MSNEVGFASILGIDNEESIPELRRLESLLNRFHNEQTYQNEDLLDSIDVFIRLLQVLCRDYFPKFQSIDLQKREVLCERVSNLCQPLKKKFKQILSNQTWQLFVSQTLTFGRLLRTDFTRKPLEFARKARIFKDLPKNSQIELINLIQRMKAKYPHSLADILDDEYQQIQKIDRDNFVITVIGNAKASKSSLINYLLDLQVCPTGNQPTTARLTKVTYGPQLMISLVKSSDESIEKYTFNNQCELFEKTKELIILKNEQRKSNLCEDIVVIELPIDELKHVELWDVPGYDENRVINQRIEEILKKTDLILAVLAQQETLRQTTIDLIKPCLNQQNNRRSVTKICFIISQIDRFYADIQTHESRDVCLQKFYDRICDELPANFPRISYQDSNQFIPMCTSYRFNPQDYLECRENFLFKSSEWFQQALHCLIRQRTDFFLKTIQQFSHYDNLVRQNVRFNRTKDIFNQRFQMFSRQLTEKINEQFTQINLQLKQAIEDIVQIAKKLFYQSESLETIENYIQTEIFNAFRQILTDQNPDLINQIAQLSTHFSNTIELKPPEIQILKQVLRETLDNDYYSDIIVQYHHTSPYHLSAYFSTIAGALSDTLKATLSLPLGDVEKLKLAYGKFRRRGTFVEEKTLNSLTNLAQELMEILTEKLEQSTEKTLQTILKNQLNRISNDINNKAQKYLHSSMDSMKIEHIRQFYTENALTITRIYLNILDLQFQLDYGSDFEIFLNERLDEQCQFAVYAGLLKSKPVAAKSIRLKDFKLQEVLYFRELKHRNLIKYYGIKRIQEDRYYIFMPRLDCDLSVYLQEHKNEMNSMFMDNIIVQIIQGLDYIHTQLELVHRDIKLENILVEKQKRRFLIADLGGVHQQPITKIYTDDYAPPELFSNNNPALITDKYDIYSLGIVIRRILEFTKMNDKLIEFWKDLSMKCRAKEPTLRPSCQLLLEARKQLNM